MKNMHDDTLELLIEGEHDVNIVEDDFDIKKAVCSLLEDLVDNVVKKSKQSVKEKCPECGISFSHNISMKRHLKQHEKELK